MKKKTLIFLILFNLIFIMQLFKNNVYASEISVNDDFDDNTILAVLGKEESISFKEYTPNDFSEINCKEVEDLTYIYQEKIDKQKEDFVNMINMDNPLKVNVDTFRRILKITISNNGKENVIDAINKLKLRNDLERTEPNYYIKPSSMTPNDFNFEEQTALEIIQLPEAWDIETGSSTVKVGVIDSGIDGTHPDLTNRVDRTLSKCFGGTYTNPLEDFTGHGTAVAGIIGAQGNNTIGMSGVCWEVSLVSLRVDNGKGLFDYAAAISAIIYAEEKDIPILNYSGGKYRSSYTMEQEITNYSGLFVCAAGNDGSNNDTFNFFPANHKVSNLISVGATTMSDEPWVLSNYGKNMVDLFAPGVGVLSTYLNVECTDHLTEEKQIICGNGCHFVTGTSFAAPYVTGVAALLLSLYPQLSSSEIKQIILNNVDSISSLNDFCVTGGRLNAFKTLNEHVVHEYTSSYIWKDYTKHYLLCSCGQMIEQGHIISSDSYNNGTNIAICLLCGGEATIGFNQNYIVETCGLLAPTDIQYITENDSFILPNGIIVLVPEDISEYFKGKLIINKNYNGGR